MNKIIFYYEIVVEIIDKSKEIYIICKYIILHISI